MSDFTISTKATILFDGAPDVDFVNLINELKRPFRNIALEFDEIEVDEHLYALFTNDRITLRIARGQVPVQTRALVMAERPAHAKTTAEEMSGILHDYADTLIVTVADAPDQTVPERLRVSVCYHIVRHILQRHEAALVQWHHTNTLFTADEFGNPADTRRPAVAPRHPAAKPRRHTERPGLVQAADTDPFAAGYMGVSENHSRLDESFARVVEADFTPAKGPDIYEQLTVYVMTLTMMVMLFPAGFAMMIFNILNGENLRTTARAMALTGVGISLQYAGLTRF